MSLPPGTRRGPYEIDALIGVGGMGEVYRARDTKLGRHVALKVIAESLASDPERIARFEREAKTLAALNHPNIAAIYGLEETREGAALVMELVEGDTLAERLALAGSGLKAQGSGTGTQGSGLKAQGSGTGAQGSGLPVGDAIAIAMQVAEALEAAHEQGIIHRDLKPANIKLRPDGTVKVLDFGLAKMVESGSGTRDPGLGSRDSGTGSALSQSPTITAPVTPFDHRPGHGEPGRGMTQAGVILGTAAYMSPEQARGKPADKRSDVWAFGCVLYEMLTGQRLFQGSDISDTLASVLRSEIDWRLLPPDLSPSVRAFLERCLHRDVRQRLHDIGDMRLALEGAFDIETPRVEVPSVDSRPLRRRALPAVFAVIATAVITGAVVWNSRGAANPPLVSRLQLSVPPGNAFYFNGRHLVAVAPDGRHIAFTAGLGLWLHRLDELEPRLVPGAEREARSPFFSPDGQSIGYYAAGELRTVSVTGGAPITLTKAVNPWGASWTDDGDIYYGQGPDGIWRVAATGGTAERVLAVGDGEQAHGPQLLPDGEWMLFTLLPAGVGSWNRGRIVLQSLRTNERVVLVEGGRDGRYLDTGHLLYALNGTLLAVSFDREARRLSGSAIPVVQNVFDAETVTGAVHFDVAANGTLVYVPRIGTDLRLTWADRNGREEAVPGEARPYRHPRVSPDGSRIAVEVEDPSNTDVWVGDARRGTFARLTINEDVDSDPIWSEDSSRVVFSSVRGASGLFWQRADGSGAAELLTEGTGGVRAFDWTRDGALIYEELQGASIRLLGVDGRSAPQEIPLFDASEYFNETLPALSPDGRWLAYQSTESGEMEVYVRPFPNVSVQRWQISAGGGFAPLWSRDGDEIFYRNETSLMAVAVTTRPAFSVGAPHALFSLGDFVLAGTRGVRYDVAPDGRFLLLKSDSGVSQDIIVVQNWTHELEELVPSD